MTGVRTLLGGGLFTSPGSTFVGGQITSLDHQNWHASRCPARARR